MRGAETMSLMEYKCPNCGGAITFDSGTQEMVCPYCDAKFDVEALKFYDEQLSGNQDSEAIDWGTEQGTEWQEGEQEGMFVYVCNSCGGEIVGDDTLGATACPFCGNPVVMMSQFSGTFRPDTIIPFKLDKEAAKKALTDHYKEKRLLPKVFKDQNHLDEVKGMYVPFWLFDADADAAISYKATRTRSWREGDYDCTETSYYGIYREGSIGFDGVPVDGSTNMEDKLMQSIEPFDMNEAVDFQTAYLSGYLANKYDLDAEACVPVANERIGNSMQEEFRRTVTGYDSVTPEAVNISTSNAAMRYAILPIWILNTSWKGKNYVFAMNGQTGKLVGDLPMDGGAFARWFIGLFAGVAAVLSVLATLFLM
jgi:DNA-directed RNA polymerase subunit RPC12/RpoP